MPNALTLTMTATRAGTATSRSTEQGSDGTFAFEDALNEEAGSQDATPDTEADVSTNPDSVTPQTQDETGIVPSAPLDSKLVEPVLSQAHNSAAHVPGSQPDVTVEETGPAGAHADRAQPAVTQSPAAQPFRTAEPPVAKPEPLVPDRNPAINDPPDHGPVVVGAQNMREPVTPQALSLTSKLQASSNQIERQANRSISVEAVGKIAVASRVTPQTLVPPPAGQAVLAQVSSAAQTRDAVEALSSPESDELPPLRDGPSGQTMRDMPSGLPPAAARAETTRAVAGQLAAVISARPGAGGVEIALNPEELGRVSITLNGRDDGMHLIIMAERPETLDLMRRHMAILSAEFERLGYGDLSLDLGMSGDAPHDGDTSQQDPAFSPTEAGDTAETLARPIPTSPEQGLDMRL